MKTLGLIGGMSWESTALYYRIINTEIRQALGKLHSARLLLYSFDFEEIAVLQQAGAWDEAAQRMIAAAQALKTAGAEVLVICTNTMHKMAQEIEVATRLPLLHIADCAAAAIKKHGLTKVGLLGTQFTMEQPFYKQRLEEKFGIQVVVPEAEEQLLVHHIIYEELCQGIIRADSRKHYETVMARLKSAGVQGIILGCTEITLLIGDTDMHGLPLFDTTAIHARYAAHYALQ